MKTNNEYLSKDWNIISLIKLEKKILENYSANSWYDRIIKDILTLHYIKAIDRSSNSANFLAKVGIFVWIVWVIATVIGSYLWYLSYIK